MSSVPVPTILAPGATTPFRFTFTREFGNGTCNATVPATGDLGNAEFSGLGNVHYELYLENSAFFVAEVAP